MNPCTPPSKLGDVPVILISGFLGSGKTSLINHILKKCSDLSGILVIVNDFGELNIDQELILNVKNEVVELTSGCICCTLVMDLKKCLVEKIPRYNPEVIIIEASGVADPSGITNLFEDTEIKTLYRLNKVVTVVDGDSWRMRSVFGDLFFNQLQAADLMIVNKTDLIDRETLDRTIHQLRENYPRSYIIATDHCAVDIENIIGDDGEPVAKRAASSISVAERGQNRIDVQASHDDGVSSRKKGALSTFSFQEKADIDKNALLRFIKKLPANVFRIKGFVKFRDRVEVLNHVGGKSHWSPWERESDTRLTIIGWDIDRTDLKNRLKSCLVTRNNA